MAVLVDALLELTVVGTFSRIGPAVRHRLAAWADAPSDALAGQAVLVTGQHRVSGAPRPRRSPRLARGSSWSGAITREWARRLRPSRWHPWRCIPAGPRPAAPLGPGRRPHGHRSGGHAV